MSEKRVYPRIDSSWPLYIESETGLKPIGEVKNISLSGILLSFHDLSRNEPDHMILELILHNPDLASEDIKLIGRSKWTYSGQNEVLLGLSIFEDLQEKKLKDQYIQFLSRSNNLQVQVRIRLIQE